MSAYQITPLHAIANLQVTFLQPLAGQLKPANLAQTATGRSVPHFALRCVLVFPPPLVPNEAPYGVFRHSLTM